jgi:hypothetical protein
MDRMKNMQVFVMQAMQMPKGPSVSYRKASNMTLILCWSMPLRTSPPRCT